MMTNEKSTLIILGCSMFFLIMGCSSHKNGAPTQGDSVGKVYVDEVVAQEVVSSADEVKVTVKGNLPSPAYSLERFDVDVKDDVIEIKPIVEYDSTRMVAQVLVPFERVCEVGKLAPGEYEVRVFCHGKPVTKSLEVKPPQ